MFQPRLGIAYDIKGDGKQVLRANAGCTTRAFRASTWRAAAAPTARAARPLFRNSAPRSRPGPPPDYGELLPSPDRRAVPARTCTCSTRTSRTRGRSPPRWRSSASSSTGSPARSATPTPRTDHLTRFFNANDPVFGKSLGQRAWPRPADRTASGSCSWSRAAPSRASTASPPSSGGRSIRTSSSRSTTRSRSTSRTTTTSAIRSPSATPARTRCRRSTTGATATSGTGSTPGCWPCSPAILPQQPGQRLLGAAGLGGLRRQQRGHRRAGQPRQAQRICPDGHVLQRNTIRKDNAFFSWDIRLSRPFNLGRQGTFEAIFEVFNVTNTDNFRDPSSGGVFRNFDGTLRSGLGEPRQFQVGGR